MAVPARGPMKKRVSKQESGIKVVPNPSSKPDELTPVQMLVVQGWIRGKKVPELARILQHHLAPHEKDEKKRLKKSRTKLRLWLRTQKMRDAVWNAAIVNADLEAPAIVNGVIRKAKAGRVDAARLALELNGRHAPHTEVQPAAINIVFAGVPRPQRPQLEDPDIIDVDAEIDEIED